MPRGKKTLLQTQEQLDTKATETSEKSAEAIMRNVNVVGYSGTDIAVFIAIAFQKLGQTVLITDRSPERDILSLFLQGESAPLTERYGVTATDDVSEYKKSNYSYHVTYYGRNVADAALAEKEELQILTTDMYAEHAKLLSNLPAPLDESEETKKLRLIVLNDVVKIKYGKKYLLELIGHKEIKKVVKLQFNPTDFEIKLSIGHEKLYLKSLTENYKLALNDILSIALGSELTKLQKKLIYSK